jgi:alpha-L-fucosidase
MWAGSVQYAALPDIQTVPVPTVSILPPLLANGQAYTDQDRGMFLHWTFATFTGTEFVDPTVWPLDTFSPTGLNIPQWASVAANFGCRYAVLTIKHLEGFCLWPTTTTTRGIANTTWYASHGNPDIVQQYVTAFRAAGVLPCYYFTINDTAWVAAHPGWIDADFKAYIQAQMTEVLTRYGQIGAIWLDSSYPAMGGWHPWASAAERNNFIRGVSPGIIIIDNSYRENLSETDVISYESGGGGPSLPAGNTNPAEFSFSIGGPTQWFWKSDTETIYDAGSISSAITNANSNNASCLVNVPPNTAGVIPQQFIDRLNETQILRGEAPRVSPNNMTSNTVPSPYVASASSEYPGGYEAYRSFNSVLDTFWSSSAGTLPAWIQIDLGSTQLVSRYMIQVRKGAVYSQWKAWTLAGSPNGSSWTTVDTRSQAVQTPGTVQFFDITPASYRYWRWTITDSNTSTGPGVGDADVGNLALI